jgi:branched-chain amino acid transport system permease protein
MVLGLPATAVVCAVLAALVGLPALRLKGPFLAATTFAFAAVVTRVLLNPIQLGDLRGAGVVVRPSLFFIGFADERAWYYFSLLVAATAAIVVRRLRAGRPGRVLIAIREDDKGVQTFAIDAVRARLSAFMLAGALAGIAGWLWVFQNSGIGNEHRELAETASITMFIVAMTGGITSVSGAVLGALFYGLTTILTPDDQLRHMAQGMPLLLLLFASPGGLAALAYRLRDSVLRLVALRRRLIVPSLFADVDPEVIYGRKVAYAEPADGRGLDAVPHERRYELQSELYPKEHLPA